VDFQSIDDRTNLAGTNRLELLMFRLNDALDGERTTLYGINVFKVREVMVLPKLIALPDVHPCIAGMANIRGNAVPVIDLNRYCGYPTDEGSRILVLTEFNNSSQGFLVNEVDNIVQLAWNDIQEPPATIANDHASMLTAISLLDEARMLLIMDVERVLVDVFGSGGEQIEMAEVPDRRSGTVFFCDDSGVARTQVGRLLDQMGLPHASARNGQEALDALRAMAEAAEAESRPVSETLLAVITDVEMPIMDGYVLTQHLKADRRFDGVPVMMHSSLSAVENRRLGMKVGADGYMSKLDGQAFARMLGELIDTDAVAAAAPAAAPDTVPRAA